MALPRRTRLEHWLRAASRRGGLLLEYQPQVDIQTQRIVGVEALLRWQHPEYGSSSPARSTLSSSARDLIHGMGAWVLMENCHQLSLWRKAGIAEGIAIPVNLSPKQLKASGFLLTVDRILATSGIEPQALVLEITGSILIEDLEQSVDLLHALNHMGVRVVIDDFNTGFSSLQYLQRLQSMR